METRQNTLKLVFLSKTGMPSYMEVLRFVAQDLRLPASMVHSVYKDENERSYYIKLMDNEAFNIVFEGMDEQYRFSFSDGQLSMVSLEMASRQMRYIRIFNLPPEAEEKEIAKVLGKYGKIRQHVRERYPASSEYPVYNGIRGVHMELEKEIPAALYIGHFRARIYYDGLKNRCFFCKAEGHVKLNCPKLAGFSSSEPCAKPSGDEKSGNNGKQLYSQVIANLKVQSATSTATSANMTVLPLTKKSTKTEAQQQSLQSPVTLPQPNRAHDENATGIIEDDQSVDSFGSMNDHPASDDEDNQNVNGNTEQINRENPSVPARGESETAAEMLIDLNDEGIARGSPADADQAVDDTNGNASSPNKRPGEKLDDGCGEFSTVVQGKGKGKKKKQTPLEAIRDRSRSLTRRNKN